MNYESFIREENNRVVFLECWFDRCIDRNDEYIPSYPYWTNNYTPTSWVEEGLDNCIESAENKIDSLILKFTTEDVSIGDVIYFDKDTKYKPNTEAGWDVYSINEFLNANHKKCNYEGYVYYGYSKIIFNENVTKDRVTSSL